MSGPPFNPPPPPEEYALPVELPSTGLSTAALVLGIVAIPATCICVGPVLGLVAVILGIIGAVRASSEPDRFSGKGRAIGGIVTGCVSILLAIATFSLWGVILAKSGGVIGRVVDLEHVGTALQSYAETHDEYPPDLATLAESGLVPANPLDSGPDATDPTAGMYYVPGLRPADPSDWILAYVNTDVFGFKLVGVLYVGGHNELVEPAEFAQSLASFKKEYEADRGEPPTILKPPPMPAASP